MWPGRLARHFARADARQDHVGNQRGFRQSSEVDEPDVLGKTGLQLEGELNRESSLAAAARAGQRDEPLGLYQVRDLRELWPAPDLACQRSWDVRNRGYHA